MGLDKKLSQLMDCPLPTNNTHIIMSNKNRFYILISSNTTLRYMFAQWRKDERTNADHYYVTSSLFLLLMRVYLHCVNTNLWNFYTNNRLFIPLQYAIWLKFLRRSPHLVHVSGKGYTWLHNDGRTNGRTQTITMSLRRFAAGEKRVYGL
jgi:hypothetical protein